MLKSFCLNWKRPIKQKFINLVLFVFLRAQYSQKFHPSHHIIIGFLINLQVQGHHPHPGNWLAARIADLTPQNKVNFISYRESCDWQLQ